eukprot:TRINITY_DN5355_c0_g1_i1.p1 TRINITY_DN5355_c0_g1~~TRINITY_DN5355_c0_g1_i1.p1  ORF type:complete len:351 (-),score=56.58 TRINITY_DN5355_c0_g1_i1:179-1162(-)
MKVLFSNLSVILSLNSDLLERLSEILSDWNEKSCIGSTFLSWAPYLKIYGQYCNNYEDAAQMHDHLHRQSTDYVVLCTEHYNNPDFNLYLQDVLIMPAQRIPRYSLLLKQLFKNTWTYHPDYENLQRSIKLIDALSDFVNTQLKYTNQQIEKVLEIKTLLGPKCKDLVQPSRAFVRQGSYIWVRKHNIKQIKMRQKKVMLFLFSDMFIIGHVNMLFNLLQRKETIEYRRSIYLKDVARVDSWSNEKYFTKLRQEHSLVKNFDLPRKSMQHDPTAKGKDQKNDWAFHNGRGFEITLRGGGSLIYVTASVDEKKSMLNDFKNLLENPRS